MTARLQPGWGLPFATTGGVAVRPGGRAELRIARTGYYEVVLDGGDHCGPVSLTLSILPRP